MALYTQIPTDQEKLKRDILALEWLLKQEIQDKDCLIYQQTLDVYRKALKRGGLSLRKIDF